MPPKKKYVQAITSAFLIAAMCLNSGCKKVSEDASAGINVPDTSVQQPVLTTSEPPVTEDVETQTAASAEITETAAAASETLNTEEETSAEVTAESESTTAETAPPETSAAPQETSVRTAGVQTAASTAEETSAVTIQTESPPEITETTTVSTTASTTVSTTAETAAQPAFAVTQNSYTALNYKKQKGIWFSYLEYSSLLMNKTASEFRTNIGKCFDNVKSLDFNTVYVQARAFGDAYYDSELFPTGDRLNGTIGAKAAFDPLEIMIEEAHSRGLSVHAWINPMRLMTDSQIKSLSDSYTVKKWYNDSSKNGTYIVKCNDRWYLNPAYDEVKQLISGGITEIAANYDIDGIQIDDYFYPTTDSSFDSAAYKASGTDKSLAKWRTDSVNSMVKAMCRAVHSANPTAVFGISPQGSVDNNVNDLYADVKAWCKSAEYCDYILPQIYYGFENPALPYGDTIALWSEMTSSGNVNLVIGLAGYKIGIVDNYAGSGKNEWINNSDMLARQIALAEKLGNYGGVAIFRYGSLFDPDPSAAKQVSKELENIKK